MISIPLRGLISYEGPISVRGLTSELIKVPRYSEIELDIDSIGGEVGCAFAIASTIEHYAGYTRGVVRPGGQASSAATLILAACRYRIASTSARFVLHMPTPEYQHWIARMVLHLADRCHRTTAAGLLAMMNTGRTLSAIEAEHIGLVHELR